MPLLYILVIGGLSLTSGKLENCLIKENHKLMNVGNEIYPSQEELNTEDCAKACSENEDCTAFRFKSQTMSNNKTFKDCDLFGIAELWENKNSQQISSGICPKSKKTLQENEIEDLPSITPNLQCIENSPEELCHFPFLYNREWQWNSLVDENGKCKCLTVTIVSATTQNTFPDYTSMDDLDNCTNCNSASCPVKGFHYSGFPLKNNNGGNDYKKVSLEECQALCKKTHGCLYFNHNDNSKTCWLKWGLGGKSEPKQIYEVFGPRNWPIDCKDTLGPWSDWSNCSVPCGEEGVEKRNRILDQPLFGGKECEAEEMEKTRTCRDKLEECPGNTNVVIGSLSLVALVTFVGGLFMFVKKRKAREGRTLDTKKIKNTILKKDDLLNNKIAVLAADTSLLNDEFKTLESKVKENVDNTMIEAKHENNRAHNRYKDIVPYDGKFITLKEPSGDPPTDYINATLIKFDGIKQTFIATQAPKPNSFQNFWQMVIEKKVKVIVMITGLLEGNKRKADQYWPDEENRVNELMDGVKLEYKETSYQGTYYHRTIKIILPNGTTSEVSQLQTTKWLDLTAPEDTNILLDLVNKTRELVDIQSDTPVVVHCSAGVGRTGTFIAVYKLIIDYFNQKVKVLDPFQTVFEMRQQRMKMVQKPPQYAYVVKCLTHVVKEEEGAYYEN